MAEPYKLHIVQPQPQAEVVEFLEALLEDAKAGKVRGMAWLTLFDRTWSAGTIGEINDPFSAAGILTKLSNEILNSL